MKSERLLSLDILRGITVAGMILVNNPGNWGSIYAPLKHAEWNGLTPTDLVFPFFVFVMGVSMSFSFSKFDYKFTPQFSKKLVRRTVILFLLGIMLSWFSQFSLTDIRILGVLQRLALTYFFGSLLVVWVPKRTWLLWIAGGILMLYYIVLYAGNGFELSDANIIAVTDKALLGENHMYREWLPDGGRIFFDPEGLLSTLPGISHVILGFFCGEIIRRKISLNERLVQLSIVGITLLFTGLLLSYGCPLNKKIWSPTYVLATCGLTYLFLVLLVWIVDIQKVQKWSIPFQAFGTNPLFIYVAASLMAILLESIPIGGIGIQERMYGFIEQIVVIPKLASVIYALLFVTVNGIIGFILFKKHIFIKI